MSENWLEKIPESYNDYYRTYRAAWCRKSGLPMMDSNCWGQIQAADLYTVSRAKKKHVSIDMKRVCAWYRVTHGYVPMFKAVRKSGDRRGGNTMNTNPECFTPEENNPYPLCVGKDMPECENCQLRAGWYGGDTNDT